MIEELVQDYWGQLIPQGGIVKETLLLHQNSHIIGSKGDLKIDNPKINEHHCQVRHDKLANKIGTYIFDKKLKKLEETILHSGDIVYLLKDNKEWIGFIYNTYEQSSKNDKEQLNPQKQEQIHKDEQAYKEESETFKKKHDQLQLQIQKIKQEDYTFEKDTSCVICYELLYNPYLLTPCLHNYCSDCLSELIRQKFAVCPQCRVRPQNIQRNYPLKNLIDTFIKKYPEKYWSEESLKHRLENNDQKQEILYQFNRKLFKEKHRKCIYGDLFIDDDDDDINFESDFSYESYESSSSVNQQIHVVPDIPAVPAVQEQMSSFQLFLLLSIIHTILIVFFK